MITFAVPFYSGTEYLERAVRSVFAQTEPGWQLLVCDDSPEGAAGPVVARFADPRVRYARNAANLGMAGNWNRCLDLSGTELVTLLHADDELLPNYAATMAAASAAHPGAAAVFCRAAVIGPDGASVFSLADRVKELLAPRREGTIRLAGPAGIARLLRGNFVMCPTVCYRAARLGARRFDGRWRFVLDLELFARLLADGETLVGVPETAYAYRRHPGSATAAYTENLLRFREEAALYDRLAAGARARGWHEVVRVGRGKRIVCAHLAARGLADLARGRWRGASAALGYLWQLTRRSRPEP